LKWFGRSVPNLAGKLQRFNAKTSTKIPFTWSQQDQKDLQEIFDGISTDTICYIPSPELEMYLEGDASDECFAVVIYQIDRQENKRPIAFLSKAFSSAMRNWAIFDREMFPIIFGIQKFRRYLIGKKVNIMTDHKPLLSIIKSVKNGTSSQRITRWIHNLFQFDFCITYLPGRLNIMADALTRAPFSSKKFQNMNLILISIKTPSRK